MAKKATQIEDVDTLLKRLEEMREAQAEFATFTQEQVDNHVVAPSHHGYNHHHLLQNILPYVLNKHIPQAIRYAHLTPFAFNSAFCQVFIDRHHCLHSLANSFERQP